VFFLIIFGVIEFGRAVMVKQSLAEAARAGARTAALATTLNLDTAESSARSHLRQTMTDSFDLNECRVSISPGSLDDLDSGTDVTATVEVDFNDVSWIAPSFMKDLVLRGEASMTRE
jgi:Flp pilus assembly protein TadG